MFLNEITDFKVTKTTNKISVINFEGVTSDSNNAIINYGYLGISGANNPIFKILTF